MRKMIVAIKYGKVLFLTSYITIPCPVCVCFHGEAIANVEMDVNVRFPSLDVDPNIYSTIAGN